MGNTLVVTAMNTDAAQPLDMEIVRREAEARAANTSTLTHPNIQAHNSFFARARRGSGVHSSCRGATARQSRTGFRRHR